MNNKMVVEVGSFEVPTGEIFAGDPCYSTDTWCAGFIKVKAGTWRAAYERTDTGLFGWRVTKLMVWLGSVGDRFDSLRDKDAMIVATASDSQLEFAKWNYGFGVDSGQFAFVDGEFRRSFVDIGKYDDVSSYYGKVCSLTHDDGRRKFGDDHHFGGGIIEMDGKNVGVASASGFGDGSYYVVSWKDDDGEVIGLSVDFMGEDEEDDENEENEENEEE